MCAPLVAQNKAGYYTKFKKLLHKEFKNFERGEEKILRHIEICRKIFSMP